LNVNLLRQLLGWLGNMQNQIKFIVGVGFLLLTVVVQR